MSRTITENQLRRFYFPLWSKCAKANGWVMHKGRLVAETVTAFPQIATGNLVDELRRQVWLAAEALALQGHRAVTAEDLRHGCTIVAVGRQKSSKDFSNKELDRVATLFRLLIEPDDIEAVIAWEHPEQGERKRLLWAIERSAPEAYIAAIASDRFGTELWQNLAIHELRQMLVTLKTRTKRFNNTVPAAARKPEEANCPF